VGLLRFVKRTQQLGFSLGEIDELLSLADGGPHNCDSAGRSRRPTSSSSTGRSQT
jgi:DNA-binding transcriptional MerR regulator